jgi:HAD superfamily hydrolase (TIGR01549 family)
MGLDVTRIKAVLFDYGNTLIRFSRPEVEACDAALGAELERLFGPVDRARLKAIRDADRIAPYHNGFHERKLAEMTTDLVQGLYGRVPDADQIAGLVRARFDAVVQTIEAPAYVYQLLGALSHSYKLGVVSNYPDGDAIRTSLRRLGLVEFFEKIVVSADVGHVKPHPLPFRTCLDALGVAPEQTLFVGDNWLADIQGAKRLGMQVIRTIQYDSPEHFEPQPGDAEPDAVIEHLAQLGPLLAVG